MRPVVNFQNPYCSTCSSTENSTLAHKILWLMFCQVVLFAFGWFSVTLSCSYLKQTERNSKTMQEMCTHIQSPVWCKHTSILFQFDNLDNLKFHKHFLTFFVLFFFFFPGGKNTRKQAHTQANQVHDKVWAVRK